MLFSLSGKEITRVYGGPHKGTETVMACEIDVNLRKIRPILV